jgi:hypothetical protein
MASRMEALGGSLPRGCEQGRGGRRERSASTIRRRSPRLNRAPPVQPPNAETLFPVPGGLVLLRRVANQGVRRLAAPKLRLSVRDVVAGQRNDLLTLGELDLKHHVRVDAE